MDGQRFNQDGQGYSQFLYEGQPSPGTRLNDLFLEQAAPYNPIQTFPTPVPFQPTGVGLESQFAFSDAGGTRQHNDSAYGTNSGGNQWHPTSTSVYGGTVASSSTVNALARELSHHIPFAQSESGALPTRHYGRQRPQHHAFPATTATGNSITSPGTINDMQSTGMPSEQGDSWLVVYAIDAENGYMECTMCHKKKKPRCDMIKHIKGHLRPYKCEVLTCQSKGFASQSDLERHTRKHMNTRDLQQSFICRNGKCRLKEKLWPRWDNFKTHLRDVHRIDDPKREDYMNKNNVAQNQDLAGLGAHQFGVPAINSATGTIPEDFDTEMPSDAGSSSAFFQPERLPEHITQLLGTMRPHPQRDSNPQMMMTPYGSIDLSQTGFTTQASQMNSPSAILQATFPQPYVQQQQLQQSQQSQQPQEQSMYTNNLHSLPHPSSPGGMLFSPEPSLTADLNAAQRSLLLQSSDSMPSPLSQSQTTQAAHSLNSASQTLPSARGPEPSSFEGHGLMSPAAVNETFAPQHATELFFGSSAGDISQDVDMEDSAPSGDSASVVHSLDYAGDDIGAPLDESTAGSTASSNGNGDVDNSSAHSKSADRPGPGSNNDDGIIEISSNDEPDAEASHDTARDDHSQRRSPTSARVSFAEPCSVATSGSPARGSHDDNNRADGVSVPDDGTNDDNEEEIELGVPNERFEKPVQRPGTRPVAGIEQILEQIKTCSPHDMSRLLESLRQSEIFHSSGYELRIPTPAQAQAQTQTQSQMSVAYAQSVKSAQTTTPSEAGEGRKYNCPHEGCKASFQSSSGLKKHETRHKRPFACTQGCKSNSDTSKWRTFGSKNDWKRHEESVHFSLDAETGITWQCDGAGDKAGVSKAGCKSVFRVLADFHKHLADDHNVREKDSKKTLVERVAKCKLIPAADAVYWCGFCRSNVADAADASPASGGGGGSRRAGKGPYPGSRGAQATMPYSQFLTARFNHIDNHFAGRQCQQMSIVEWKTPEQAEAEAKAQAQAQAEREKEKEKAEGSRHAQRKAARANAGPSRLVESRKRHTDEAHSVDGAKKHKSKAREVHWSCCVCNDTNTERNDACLSCSQRRCVNCQCYYAVAHEVQ